MGVFSEGASLKRMYFIFNGQSSKEFGLYLTNPSVYNSPEPDVVRTSIPGLNGDLIQDNAREGLRRFSNIDVEYNAYITSTNVPERIRKIKEWLMPPTGYQILTDSYDPDFYRMGFCTQVTENDVKPDFGASLKIVFNCKPQRWSYEGDETIELDYSTRSTVGVTNPYSFPALPTMRIYGEKGKSDTLYVMAMAGEGFSRVDILSFPGSYIDLNCETQNAYYEDEFCNDLISSDNFIILYPGGNSFSISEKKSITKIDLTPKWWTL